ETNGSSAAHAYGTIFFQRVAVPLDAKKDPVAPGLTLAGLDGRGVGDTLNTIGPNQVALANAANSATDWRAPSVAGLLGGNNESVITYIDRAGNIHLRVYLDEGALSTSDAGGAATGANPASVGVVAQIGSLVGMQHVMALAGGGFVVAWIANAGNGDLVL